jgi:hypothetical protein
MIDVAVLVLLAGCGLLVWLVERRAAAPSSSGPAPTPAPAKTSAVWTAPSAPTYALTPGGSTGVVEAGGGQTAYFALPAGATWPDPVANPGVQPVTFGAGSTLTGVFQGFNVATQQPTGAQPQGTDAIIWTGLSGAGTAYFQFIMPDGSVSYFMWQLLPQATS